MRFWLLIPTDKGWETEAEAWAQCIEPGHHASIVDARRQTKLRRVVSVMGEVARVSKWCKSCGGPHELDVDLVSLRVVHGPLQEEGE